MATDYEKAHNSQMARYAAMVSHIYRTAAGEAAKIGASVTGFDSSKPFEIDKYPATSQKIRNLLLQLYNNLNTAILDGVNASWTLANNKNSELARLVFGDNLGRLSEDEYRRYFTNNDTALASFIKRKEDGMNLSDKVWKYTKQYKGEIELALDLGIGQGKSAVEMAKDLRQYLNNPDALYRRVRDKYGNLHLSKNAAAYHPGQGVYRSAVRNAQRLSRTENNMAYRTADFIRWQEADYVVGIKVMLSNNHTTKNSKGEAVPFTDICDELQGNYPKTFHFRGWHPHCRCKAIPITKTEEEIEKDTADILAGRKPGTGSRNTIKDVPQAFKNWAANNTERFAKSAGQPYFVRDNFANGDITQGLKHNISPQQQAVVKPPQITPQPPQVTQPPKPKPVRPPKTAQEEAAIRKRWQDRKARYEEIKKQAHQLRLLCMQYLPDVDASHLDDLANKGRYNELQAAIIEMKNTIKTANEAITANKISCRQEEEMNHVNANQERANPMFDSGVRKYHVNCQSCVVAYELRRRGFDVEARGNEERPDSITYRLSKRPEMAWIDPETGRYPSVIKAGGWNPMNTRGIPRNQMLAQFDKITATPGRYHAYFYWKGSGGHIITAERLQSGQLRLYDPQTGKHYDDATWEYYTTRMVLKHGISVYRSDGFLINNDIISGVVRR